jgi:phosphate starvation-inducible PhoH-like protein
MTERGAGVSEDVVQRVSAEGADPLLLAGVNDTNLVELQRALGVRVSFRGDALTVSGAAEPVERAVPVVQGLVDLARMGEPVSVEDVFRLAADGPPAEAATEQKILLPGLRRAIVPKTQGQRDYLLAISTHDIVVGIGPAGTGKTYLAVAKAVEALARKRVKRIILARPAVEAGESLGFLPGDLQAKVDPYLRPLYDALEDMMPHERVQKALESRTIEIAPLAYMRGRTLADAFIILDEAQNATGAQMKMFLTRLGVNSRTVVTGDKTQIDLPRREDSGLVQIERILPGIEGIGFCYLHEGDVVRHRLVREVIRAYAEDQNG